jgi:hypothetical protein
MVKKSADITACVIGLKKRPRFSKKLYVNDVELIFKLDLRYLCRKRRHHPPVVLVPADSGPVSSLRSALISQFSNGLKPMLLIFAIDLTFKFPNLVKHVDRFARRRV